MECGGNAKCAEYFTANGVDLSLPQTQKYNNYVAEDYKAKLTAEVEGQDWTQPDHSGEELFSTAGAAAPAAAAVAASASMSASASSRNSPGAANFASKKEQNEQYFAKLGSQNESRPTDLKPSEGGKYQGFGSTPAPAQQSQQQQSSFAGFTMDSFQADPLGTFTKGWGLFSSTVAKSVKDVNDQVIQPSMKQLQEQEQFIQAKRAMEQFGQKTYETLVEPQHNDSQYGKLFDGLGEESDDIKPAFGLAKPAKKSTLPGIGSKPAAAASKEDDWEAF